MVNVFCVSRVCIVYHRRTQCQSGGERQRIYFLTIDQDNQRVTERAAASKKMVTDILKSERPLIYFLNPMYIFYVCVSVTTCVAAAAESVDLFRWDSLPLEPFSETCLDLFVRRRSCHTTTHTLHIGALMGIKDTHMQLASPIQQVDS
jgi:hypothetical protein